MIANNNHMNHFFRFLFWLLSILIFQIFNELIKFQIQWKFQAIKQQPIIFNRQKKLFNFKSNHYQLQFCSQVQYSQFINMNMSQNSDAFSIVKNQILKQKYECINMCMKQTEKRVKDIKKKNIQLRQMIAHKEQENINFQNIVSLQIEQNLKKYQDQQRDKLHRLEQLKRLIQQYKFLCGESIKYKSVRSQVKYQSNKTETINPHMEQSSRQNSFLNNLNTSQSQNTNNLSFVRNKSYTKIKTKIYCQECEVEYKPNEYYRHMQEYHNQNYASRPQIVTNRTKQNPNGKLSGYNTMRN